MTNSSTESSAVTTGDCDPGNTSRLKYGNLSPINCAACGKFIRYSELHNGGRARFYFEPASHFGPEVCEWTCASCVNKTRGAPNEEAQHNEEVVVANSTPSFRKGGLDGSA